MVERKILDEQELKELMNQLGYDVDALVSSGVENNYGEKLYFLPEDKRVEYEGILADQNRDDDLPEWAKGMPPDSYRSYIPSSGRTKYLVTLRGLYRINSKLDLKKMGQDMVAEFEDSFTATAEEIANSSKGETVTVEDVKNDIMRAYAAEAIQKSRNRALTELIHDDTPSDNIGWSDNDEDIIYQKIIEALKVPFPHSGEDRIGLANDLKGILDFPNERIYKYDVWYYYESLRNITNMNDRESRCLNLTVSYIATARGLGIRRSDIVYRIYTRIMLEFGLHFLTIEQSIKLFSETAHVIGPRKCYQRYDIK